MVTGAPLSLSDESEIRIELQTLLREAERLVGRLKDLHGRLAIPPGDDLMLVGEKEPVFLHVVRGVLECVQGDYLELLVRDLKSLVEEESTGR